ncbi:MAG: hypothetical protein HYV27_12170 [Candidatus Hydrogenedentes bacterium]|nr:hypothetical protein [Candidatus Hydrogenedentota bacterium]
MLALAPLCVAQEAAPGQHWYWWLQEQLQFVAQAAEEDAATPAPPASPRLADEVRQLRTEVNDLKATVELYLGSMLASMQEENARLRAEVQRLQALEGLGPEAALLIPSPYNRQPYLPETLPTGVPTPDELMPGPEPEAAAPAGGYEVIKEYGRTPEDVAKSDKPVSALKGMTVLVEPGMPREKLEALGRELYAQYQSFDNINIEIYDDRVAANEAAETGNSSDPKHRVLIVSKYAADNRRLMIYLGGSTPETTPLE